MTIQIKSTISRTRLEPNRPDPWIVSSAASDAEAKPSDAYLCGRSGTAETLAEAQELAAAQRAEIDAELMEGVYALRSARREAKVDPICTECGKDVPHGDLHIDVGGSSCVIEKPASYMMEPTA